MKTLNLCKTLLLVSTIFFSQSWGMDAEQEMRSVIERKKKGRYGPSETFINFSQTFESSTPDDKATLVKIYEKLKSRDGDDSAITTIALEYKGQSISELAKTHGVEVAAIGARAYGYQDGSSNWIRMPAAVAAPVRASAGQTIVDLDGNVLPLGGEQGVFAVFNNAKDFNLDVAQVKDQLLAQIRLIGVNPKNIPAYLKDLYDQLDAIQRGKAAPVRAAAPVIAPEHQEMIGILRQYVNGRTEGSFFTFQNIFNGADSATRARLANIYEDFKVRHHGKDSAIATMAARINSDGLAKFLADNDAGARPVAAAHASAAVLLSPEQRKMQQMRNLIERKKLGPFGASGLFVNFAGIFDSLSQGQRNTLVRVYDKLSEHGEDSAITTIALEYGNGGIDGMVRRHLENPLPAAGAGGGYGYGAQHGYHPPRAAEAVDDHALAQRLQAQEEADQRQRYAAAAYPAAQDFGAGGAAAAYRQQDAVAPIVAPVRPALQAAAVPAPNADVAPEEFNDREMRILYDAYNVVMQRIQRPNAARIQQLEKEIHTQQRVLDSVAVEGRMAYSAAQIANAKRELETLVAERERLAKAADDIMNEYAVEFNRAASPLLKAQTAGAQAIMGALQENGQDISYGKILSFLNESMGW